MLFNAIFQMKKEIVEGIFKVERQYYQQYIFIYCLFSLDSWSYLAYFPMLFAKIAYSCCESSHKI